MLVGVDGGATKTVALIADASGQVVGVGRAGSSDIHNQTSAEAAVGEVVASVLGAGAGAGVPPRDLRRGVFSLCGADWPEDIDYYTAHLEERLSLKGRVTVMNDAFGALRAGTTDGFGAALVLGTGAAIAARGQRGEEWFSGERLEASGARYFGRWAYERLIRGEYGGGPVPGFRAAALDAYDVSSVEGMIHRVARLGGLGFPSLARLAPVVIEAGHAGDPLVVPFIEGHARLLADYVREAARRVSLISPRPAVVTSGGVFRHHCTDLADAFAANLPEFEVIASNAEPVYGALLTAGNIEQLDLEVDQLRATGPEAGYFSTT